jgi:hypothetical protein
MRCQLIRLHVLAARRSPSAAGRAEWAVPVNEIRPPAVLKGFPPPCRNQAGTDQRVGAWRGDFPERIASGLRSGRFRIGSADTLAT